MNKAEFKKTYDDLLPLYVSPRDIDLVNVCYGDKFVCVTYREQHLASFRYAEDHPATAAYCTARMVDIVNIYRGR